MSFQGSLRRYRQHDREIGTRMSLAQRRRGAEVTYLRLTGNKLGYLLNFAGEVMKTGITRCVNGLPE
jgi:hypothetical protein